LGNVPGLWGTSLDCPELRKASCYLLRICFVST
jgi:hypothetical protein